MAIRSFATAINKSAYTKVGSNTTVFAATERLVGEINVVVTDVGDATPAPGETQYIPFNELYRREGAARDIWMIIPSAAVVSSTTVYGEAE
jgi:hypothetical protein